jgi:hypothetical protein
MPIPRITIRSLMATVAIVAAELGFFANLEGGIGGNVNGLVAVNVPFVWLAVLQLIATPRSDRE